jgi:methionyl-tRNA formyltransferase
MKLLILCNDRLALPALSQLMQMNLVAGVGMTARPGEVQTVVSMMCSQFNVPLMLFRKRTFAEDLDRWIQQAKPDAVWVKTFPWKIPDAALTKPRLGFINFHYAPLPEYRGANPLFWMIRNGVKEGGVTVHVMTGAMDDGPILLTSKVTVHPGTTFGMMISQLGFSGAELSGKLLQLMQIGHMTGAPQDSTKAMWYNRPTPADLWIDWSTMNAEEVSRLVNACNPWNKGAPAKLNNWMMGLTYVSVVAATAPHHQAPGTILTMNETMGLSIACRDNTVIRADVVFVEEGFMPGFALAGFGIQPGMVFSR